MTRSGVIAGTPQYMSPEQARGDNVDGRSDLFSLGSVMYAMSTGRPPFRAETSYGILRRITDTEPRLIREVNPGIPEWFERVIQRLLAKSPDDRIPTADHIATLLQKCLAHLQQPTVVELPEECRVRVRRKESWPKSPRSFLSVALITVSCLVIAGIFALGKSMFNESDPAGFSEAKSTETGRANGEGSLSVVPEWDSIQTDIDTFDKELGPSEADAGRFWQTKSDVKPP